MTTPLMDLTGKLDQSKIVFDDDFSTGMQGWCQLSTPHANATNLGAVFKGNRGSFSGNTMVARTSDTPSVKVGGEVMALKRSQLYYGEEKYLIEFWTSIWDVTADISRPQWYAWGLDTAKHDGTRQFFEVRWLNFDEATNARVTKFQVNINGGWVDVPNGVWDIPTNENKDMVFYLALEVNLATGRYEGIRVNNFLKEGSLADVDANDIRNLGVVNAGSLPTFAGGLNATISVVNRSAAYINLTSGRVDLHRARLSYAGA